MKNLQHVQFEKFTRMSKFHFYILLGIVDAMITKQHNRFIKTVTTLATLVIALDT